MGLSRAGLKEPMRAPLLPTALVCAPYFPVVSRFNRQRGGLYQGYF